MNKLFMVIATIFVLCSCQNNSAKPKNLYEDFTKEYYKLLHIQDEYRFVSTVIESPIDIPPPSNTKLGQFYKKYKKASPQELKAFKSSLNTRFDEQYKITLTKYIYYTQEFRHEGMEVLKYEDFKTTRINKKPFYVGRGLYPIDMAGGFYFELKEEYKERTKNK